MTSEKEMENPLIEDPDGVHAAQRWLKVVATVRNEQDKAAKSRNITITIADVSLRDYIRNLLGPYIEHFSKSAWEKSEVSLSQDWNEVLYN